MLGTPKKLPDRLFTVVRSVRFRLALWFVLILGVVVVSFSAFIYTRQKQELELAAFRRLDFRTRRLEALLHITGPNFIDRSALPPSGDPDSNSVLSQEGEVFAFVDTGGQVVQNWGTMDANGISQLFQKTVDGQDLNGKGSPMPRLVSTSAVGSQSKYVMLLAPVALQGKLGGFILLADPIDPDNQLPRLFVSLTLGVLSTLAIAMIGGVWLADRAMRPVKTITHTAQTIGETDLSMRLHLEQKDELGELADTFDAMLDRLQAAFERQRQFTADASHELRTPLTIVELEASRVLAAQHSPADYERALAIIYSENQFMIRLVNNLLTLARMDAGQVVLHKEEVDLSDVALEVVERLAPLAAKDQVRISTGDLPELLVSGDRQYLFQMLTNLVENAIKYSAADEKRVLVETGMRDANKQMWAWARISDNGPGISPEYLPHLFDRFYQVDKARTRQESDYEDEGDQTPSGTGLGLSIAQWIAQAHGGEIQVQSEPGVGSTFEVSLPVIPSASTP